MKNKLAQLALIILFLSPNLVRAQSIDDLELRKSRSQKKLKLGFGFLGLMETATGLNADRPELTSLLFVAPQLKIGNRMRLRLNVGLIRNWLARQQNPWDMTDISLQFSHLGFYQEPWSKIRFSGNGRYYFPTSKASRNAGSYGQVRLTGKASRTISRFFFAFEFSGQKYFHRYTSWDTTQSPGSDSWYHSGGFDDFIQNNASFGFSETFTASASVFSGLDLSAIWSMYQNRQYQPDSGHSSVSGSSYLKQPRNTVWSHYFRFVLDATYNIGALPWVRASSLKDSLLSKTFVSAGYALFAPQLQNRERNLNPFNPKYAQAYLDLMVIY